LPNGDFVLSTGQWYFLQMKNLSLNFLPNQNFPCPQNRPSPLQASMAPKKRTMPLAEKMRFPVGGLVLGIFLFPCPQKMLLVAISTLTLSADRGCVRPNFFCGTNKEK